MKDISMHYKMYKPFGMLSQFHSNAPKEKHKKRFIGEVYDFPKGLMAIGRLDEKSEGLLLLSTDGDLSNKINTAGIEKEYWAQLDGVITPEAIEYIKKGVDIGLKGDKYKTKPCSVHLMKSAPILPEASSKLRIGHHRPNSWIRLILKEGKFRQVRKMTAAVGFPTLRLIRARIGNIHLDNMLPEQVEPIDLDLNKLL